MEDDTLQKIYNIQYTTSKVIALLVAATLCVGLAQRGQRRGQEGRGENAQAGQAAQQGTQEGEDFQEEGQEGPRGQGNSDHVR